MGSCNIGVYMYILIRIYIYTYIYRLGFQVRGQGFYRGHMGLYKDLSRVLGQGFGSVYIVVYIEVTLIMTSTISIFLFMYMYV